MTNLKMHTWSDIRSMTNGSSIAIKSGDASTQCPTKADLEVQASAARVSVIYNNSPSSNQLVSVNTIFEDNIVVTFEVLCEFQSPANGIDYADEWAENREKNSTLNPLTYIKDAISGHTPITWSEGDTWTYDDGTVVYEYSGDHPYLQILVNGSAWNGSALTLSGDTTIRYIFDATDMNGDFEGDNPIYVPKTYVDTKMFNIKFVRPLVEIKDSVGWSPVELGEWELDYDASVIRKYIDVQLANQTISSSDYVLTKNPYQYPQFNDSVGYDTFAYYVPVVTNDRVSGAARKEVWLSDVFFDVGFDHERQRIYLAYNVYLTDIDSGDTITLSPIVEGIDNLGEANLQAVITAITNLGLNIANVNTYSGTATFKFNFSV